MFTIRQLRQPRPPAVIRRLLGTAAVCLLSPLAAEASPLELLQALPIGGLDNAQPSGLVIVDGELYAVSDQHDHAVCRIELRKKHAVISPYVTFNAPWSGSWARGLDFEGLAYKDGFFFLLSESLYRVLRVHETGSDLAWVTPSVEAVGREAGLFNEKNARLEGLALLGGGAVILAAERAPRGMVDILIDPEGTGSDEVRLAAYAFDDGDAGLPKPREPDFSDLFFDGESLYALARNAEAVVRFAYDGEELLELEVWSYAAVTNDPEFAYLDMTYGRAEGLCMDAERVYIVLDNNGQGRQTDPTDTRPQLFIFSRPR